MFNSNLIKNIPPAQSNILHNYSNKRTCEFSTSSYSNNKFDNLILNSNLEQTKIIK